MCSSSWWEWLILRNFITWATFHNRPRVIDGQEMLSFLNRIREMCSRKHYLNKNDLSDDEFNCIAPISKQQFGELLAYCDPVEQHGNLRYISEKDLLTFLCEMRQGLSDDFFKVIFGYPSRQSVSSVISYVRKPLSNRFVRENIGPASITRQDYILQHVTAFSNAL